jgi:hypothetical protein
MRSTRSDAATAVTPLVQHAGAQVANSLTNSRPSDSVTAVLIPVPTAKK